MRIFAAALLCAFDRAACFISRTRVEVPHAVALQAKGFGGGGSSSSQASKKKGKKGNRLVDTLEDKPKRELSANMPFVRSEQDDLLDKLANQAAKTCIGRAVASAPVPPEGIDPFWELMPSLISSRFSNVPDEKLQRVAGMVRHTLDKSLPLEDSIRNDPFRPHDEIHAYMPGLGETKPFHDPNQLELCKLMSQNYETIKKEYEALVADKKDRFQSVTSMNYESGWRTLVLFYNGHRIPDFPYHLCPTTTKILETVPLAGRVSFSDVAFFSKFFTLTFPNKISRLLVSIASNPIPVFRFTVMVTTCGELNCLRLLLTLRLSSLILCSARLTCQMGIQIPEGKCNLFQIRRSSLVFSSIAKLRRFMSSLFT